MTASSSQTFVAVEQWERSNIPIEKNHEREGRASVKTPLIQSTTSRIFSAQAIIWLVPFL